MQTHPVPQNIASYEFRLVGDMTLKQFLFLAAGALLGLLVWKLPIPFSLVRGLLATVPVGLGILAAFVPISGRPFTQWISAFFKAIYSPTLWEWETPVEKTLPSPAQAPEPAKAPVLSMTGILTQAIGGGKSSDSAKPVPASSTQTTSSVFTAPPKPAPEPAPSVSLPEEAPAIPSAPPAETPAPPTQSASFSPDPLPPLPHSPQPTAPAASPTSSIAAPTSPNILTGLVVDQNQLPIASATVEIIDSKTGIPTRALRTNRLGQFQIAIPLPLGTYTLQTEKEGFTFTSVSVTVNNSLIPPVLISAQPAVIAPNPVTSPANGQVTKF